MPTQQEIRQNITNQIIESLENGNLPAWRKPWNDDPNAGINTSLSTGNSYRGINQLILQLASANKKFQSKWWGTFSQINLSGGRIRRGEKGTKIVLWKPVNRLKKNEQGEEIDDSFVLMKQYCVFNAEQTIGLDEFQIGFSQIEDTDNRDEKTSLIIEATNADIRHGGNEAFYSPSGDFIQCPFRHQFSNPNSFYEVMFHELTHWTEHSSRLDWDRKKNSYAMCELIAEIGCCYLMGELNLPVTDSMENHSTYIKGWLKEMNNDPKFIFKASSQATKAVDYILSFSKAMEPEPVPF